MAARMRKTHQDDVRSKIQASVIIGRLAGHVSGEVDMSPTQIKAAEILLRKTLPDLATTEIIGNEDQPVVHKVVREIVRAKDSDA